MLLFRVQYAFTRFLSEIMNFPTHLTLRCAPLTETNVGRPDIYPRNCTNFHSPPMANDAPTFCIRRVSMLILSFPPFCCLRRSIDDLSSRAVRPGDLSDCPRRFLVVFRWWCVAPGANTEILRYVFLRRRRSEDLTTSFLEIIILLSLPRRFPLFLLFFGAASKHVDGNIIVRISRGGIR